MQHPTPLSRDECSMALGKLNDWDLDDAGKLYKEFPFPSFQDAVAFMVRVFMVAEAMNHHPELTNNYHTVEIRLITQRIGSLSQLDFDFATKVDQIRQ